MPSLGGVLSPIVDWLFTRRPVVSLLRRAPNVAWVVDRDEVERRYRQRDRVAAARAAFDVYARSHQPIKIHLGCGPRVLRGWLNVDLVFNPNWWDGYPDTEQRGDASDHVALDLVLDGLPWPDRSVDVIYHEDFIEHLSQKDAVLVLAETYRVMKAGAVQRISTPDLSASLAAHSNFERGAAGVYREEWDEWGHLNVFTERYLDELCRLIGFSSVERSRKGEGSFADMPPDYRPLSDRPSEGNLFFDLVK